jgi:hypothetical protein
MTTKIEMLLECLAANYAAQCVLDNVHMNIDCDNPSIEFQAIEMHAFDIVLSLTEDNRIVEVVDGDLSLYDNVNEYCAMIRTIFS